MKKNQFLASLASNMFLKSRRSLSYSVTILQLFQRFGFIKEWIAPSNTNKKFTR